jgi:Xaa-Pro dipeptidase
MASILKQKYPAKSHIHRVVDELKLSSSDFTASSIIFIEGTKNRAWPDSDMEVPFRQSRYFYYVTGCNQPDCSYSFDVSSGKSTLYIPPQPEERVMVFNGWCTSFFTRGRSANEG